MQPNAISVSAPVNLHNKNRPLPKIHCLRFPNGCSTVARRMRIISGRCFNRNVHACKGILMGMCGNVSSACLCALLFQRTKMTVTFSRCVNDRALIHLFAPIVNRMIGRHIDLNLFTLTGGKVFAIGIAATFSVSCSNSALVASAMGSNCWLSLLACVTS